MPQEAIEEKLTFKSEEEKLQRLSEMEDSPPSNIKSEEDMNQWIREQEMLQKKIEEAEIVPEPPPSEELPPEPQVQEESLPESQVQEEVQPAEESQIPPEPAEEEPPAEPPPPQEEDVIQFSVKRDELPDILKPYKSADEILRSAAHARKYANDAEKKMKALEMELENLKTGGQKAPATPMPESTPITPVPQPESHADDLNTYLQKLESMEDTDYADVAAVKGILSVASKEIADTKKELNSLKSTLGEKLTTIEKTNKEKAEKEEKDRQMLATVKGINDLQNEFPELKTNKPPFYIMGQTDCVERDVEQWADQVLFSKFGNSKPSWQQRNAIINAYLEGNTEITAYCQQNAITPESVGTTADDIRKYATLINVDANMRGEEIDRITGERKQKISPYNGNPVNFDSFIASYKNLKDATGITAEEHKEQLAKAEIRGQQRLSEAMEQRAEASKPLGDKGASPPQQTEEITKQRAWELINEGFDEFAVEQAALGGDRTLFHKYNKALEVAGFAKEPPPEHWPPEKTK